MNKTLIEKIKMRLSERNRLLLEEIIQSITVHVHNDPSMKDIETAEEGKNE